MISNEKVDDRNVTDFYKYWETDAIKADLDSKRHLFAVLVERVNGDFNFSTIVRNNNCFLGQKVIRSGLKRWDKRGAVGANHYEHIEYAESACDVVADYRSNGYRIVAVDNVDGAIGVDEYFWHPKSLMVFGEEGRGISDELLRLSDDIIYIKQYGSVRSLNVGTASGIIMYDYCSKVGKL